MMPMTDSPTPTAALDYDSTLILAVEISKKTWVVAAQVPGLAQTKTKQKVTPTAVALMELIDSYRRRAQAAGKAVNRVILVYEAGSSGFWLARWLLRRGIEVQVVQPSSV